MEQSKYEVFKQNVLDEIETALFKLDESMSNNKDEYLQRYKNQIQIILKKLLELQETNIIGELGVIDIVLSRINIDNEILLYKIYVYGKNMYVDEYENIFLLDVSDIYKYFLECKKNLYISVKRYVGVIEVCDVDCESYSYIKYFNMYIVNLLREIFMESEIIELIRQLITVSDFFIIHTISQSKL